jgi:glutamate-ammonia-ligase adenylyltransferase
MEFRSRLTRSPLAYDTGPAAEIRNAFADLAPELAGLLAATAGCSPYLRDLMRREEGWLREALSLAPETAVGGELAAIDLVTLADLPDALRRAKRRIALLTALADLGGVWTLEEVTTTLTALADRAVDRSLRLLSGDEIRRGKLPGQTPQDAETGAGLFALAMGKMGAGELNYSSDIDLICLFDHERYGDAALEARPALIRVVRKMAAILSDVTAGGYVFRTDLRLRPDASVTPVCISMLAAETYYESVGRTWERAAYIKARPCGGDLAAGARFLCNLTPFVWRKHLDFAAIQDAHDMRLRIREHRGLHGAQVEGQNVKLGLGGIREIEFFAQTRQLIAGGRDASLRDPTTIGALAALRDAGWLPADVTAGLSADYRIHRELEHRLQMVGDAQTQTLPVTPGGVARIAAFMGMDEAAFRADFLDRITRVDAMTEGFFAPSAPAAGIEISDSARAIVENWQNYPALRSDRAQAIFRRLCPALLVRLKRAANPDEALLALDGFLSGLPAGVQLFALFEANPVLIDLIVDIAATSPALARYLARNAGVLDAVIGGAFWREWTGKDALYDDLSRNIAALPDYERKLDEARRWMKEWHFRIGVHHLRGLIGADEAGKAYADLAEVVIGALWPVVVAEFSRRHGAPPGRGAVVMAMGSLGAGRLNAGSDLDLIVIYDAAGLEASEGEKPLTTRSYFARLTQALVTALTAPMAEGRLYEVDMRLRPSGRQGPVATSWEAFQNYQSHEAWSWEHLALTRGHVLAGDEALAREVEGFRRDLLLAKGRDAPRLRADLAAMRSRLAGAKPARGSLDAKNGPGRMMDIELIAQMAGLLAGSPLRRVAQQIAAGVKSGELSVIEAESLQACHRLFWQVQAVSRLLSDGVQQVADMGEGARAFLLRETGEADIDHLVARLDTGAATAAAIISAHLDGGDGETGVET